MEQTLNHCKSQLERENTILYLANILLQKLDVELHSWYGVRRCFEESEISWDLEFVLVLLS